MLYPYLFLISDKALAFFTSYSISIFICHSTHFIGNTVLLGEKEAEKLAFEGLFFSLSVWKVT
jgi:hypothetical protein